MSAIWQYSSGQNNERSSDDVTGVAPEMIAGPPPPPPNSQQQQRPDFQTRISRNRPQGQRPPNPPPNTTVSPWPPAPTPGRKSSIDGRMGPIPTEGPQDSLSLGQLKRIVAGFQRPEKMSCYDYTYNDFGSFAEEISEWFVDGAWSWNSLDNARRSYYWQWEDATQYISSLIAENDPAVHDIDIAHLATWEDATTRLKDGVVRGALDVIKDGDISQRSPAIGSLTYIALGRWEDTAHKPAKSGSITPATEMQLEEMVAGISIMTKLGGLPIIWDTLLKMLHSVWDVANNVATMSEGELSDLSSDMMHLMTILYVAMQVSLSYHADVAAPIATQIIELKPPIVETLLIETTKRRFDDGDLLPQTQMLLLLWKSILVVFGGSKELLETKKAASESSLEDKAQNLILASPLDYHVFRDEIASKYPAYIPPHSNLPYDNIGKSLLSALSNQPQRNAMNGGIIPPAPGTQIEGSTSILNQPVHIATPAPSPPPSPAAGGKAIKKQNYQTNQDFPFLYPPLDATSNSAGGKGFAGEQWESVGRRWEGSELPTSIIEAGNLFSDRVRMSRAMRQMWEEREAFLKEDKGWDPVLKPSLEPDATDNADDNDDIESLDLSELTLEEKQELARVRKLMREEEDGECVTRDELGLPEVPIDLGPNPEMMMSETKRRLLAVDSFYRQGLPYFQSLVIVLLKTIMANVSSLPVPVPQSAHPVGLKMANSVQETHRTPEEMDRAKGHEVTAKAVTGILILLLKWFKVSHVLKFEYLTQLLLDSNYLPLVLKFFIHQEIANVVESKTDRPENSFFHMCNVQAKAGASESESDSESDSEARDKPENSLEDSSPKPENEAEAGSSEDDAIPPPIKRRRSPPLAPLNTSAPLNSNNPRPEVDELGFPVNAEVPLAPVTDFSRRNFFSLINYLRVLQKICKGKAHRNLLMVTYKSSTILRKSLRVPQDDLRLYTLKLIKSQVSFCGRKWRQSHMRVITAIYLHCRPEFRDEWLSGSDVDGDIESALPLEQALRSLTHWSNVRRYPEKVAAANGVRTALKAERDFFAREVEKLGAIDLSGSLEDSQGGSNGDH
ncbi:Factor arrest protein 11 [Ceratocystis fimbriata CBS 114723]|uniref:Factor arrest protein 11 n=1 Tax=Ceratocystis fimbriata CBS 114723 TaxID=1035309 RepID=A0A2C5WTP4_9PEZI|nr:Factor arrest protein 11 [Ceratocystis fimbriata CBS 114723]